MKDKSEREVRLNQLKESVISNHKKMTREDIAEEAQQLHIWRFQAQEYIAELEAKLEAKEVTRKKEQTRRWFGGRFVTAEEEGRA